MASAFSAKEAPPDGAPLSPQYSEFGRVPLPSGMDGESAWVGSMQPFRSDSCARSFLQDIEADLTVWVSGGRIRDSKHIKRHWANPSLVKMAVTCQVLVLLQRPPAHPRSYLLSPIFPEYYSIVHPHPRFDQQIEFGGIRFPGLCIYSAAEFQFETHDDLMTQYLDQLTIFLAKHLIWLRTRQLFRGYPPRGSVVRSLLPGEDLADDTPRLVQPATHSTGEVWEYWRGYWPGRAAAGFNPETHLENIAAEQECWCGSGSLYGDCHRPKDKASVGR